MKIVLEDFTKDAGGRRAREPGARSSRTTRDHSPHPSPTRGPLLGHYPAADPLEPRGPPRTPSGALKRPQLGPRGTGRDEPGTHATGSPPRTRWCHRGPPRTPADPLGRTLKATARPQRHREGRAWYPRDRLAAPHAMVPPGTPADPLGRRQAPKTGPGDLQGPPGTSRDHQGPPTAGMDLRGPPLVVPGGAWW